MRFKTIKSKLLVAVFFMVITSGLVIALLVTQRYSKALRNALVGQAENVAHAIALDVADKILINDLVALQRVLDHQTRTNPALGYIFVVRDGQVLAHTFDQGVPVDLPGANVPVSQDQPHFQRIVSTRGEPYLDMAWPIFAGKAGVLRLGVSENRYRDQVKGMWLEIGAFTLGALLVALAGSLWFVRRITRPLATLVRATQEIDEGKPGVRVAESGDDEIATLAKSFNRMVNRQEEYTQRLEDQAMELERAHSQTKTACKIVREISALRTLDEMGAFLLGKLQETVVCRHLSVAALSPSQDALFVLSSSGTTVSKDPEVIKAAREIFEGSGKVTFTRKLHLKPPLLPADLSGFSRWVLIPLNDAQVRGAAIIACSPECRCSREEIEWVGMILSQNAGALRRAILHEEDLWGLEHRVETASGFGDLIGKDPRMQVVYKLIEDVAPSDATVLIQGESGTGKELVARAIHRLSPRRDKPLVVINCSAYPATLLESELFGHEKGAFTGALRQKLGRFEQAHGGTVLLDEVGEIPPPAQIKLLRVLQTRRFERVGGEQTLTVDVRILAATHKDLLAEVKNGNFREDLFYRLNVIPILLPPLRERRNDIPRLALYFLRRFAAERGKDIKEISSEAMRLLLDYPWPGNVRELENAVEHATVLAKGGLIEVWDLPAGLRHYASAPPSTLGDRELRHLLETLEQCGWNKKLAAQQLGISRSTIYTMLRRHNISLSKPMTH